MDRQRLRKATTILFLSLALALTATTVMASPANQGAEARHQASTEGYWWTGLLQSLWDSILSVGGAAPETVGTTNGPEPTEGTNPDIGPALDPLG